jgi:PIN domain nuclease of toxin-antitoxin system
VVAAHSPCLRDHARVLTGDSENTILVSAVSLWKI